MRGARPYVIGLTGNIATGKSTVGQLLAGWGAEHLDADGLAHQVIEQGTPAWQQVVAEFGEQVLAPNGEVDRRRLGGIVFVDPQALARLEAIVHPEVIARIQGLISRSQARVVVIEAIKLIESGLARQLCDVIWVVTAPRAAQIRRLIEQRHLACVEAALHVDAQPSQEAKVEQAHVVIENDGDYDRLVCQVRQAWGDIGKAHP